MSTPVTRYENEDDLVLTLTNTGEIHDQLSKFTMAWSNGDLLRELNNVLRELRRQDFAEFVSIRGERSADANLSLARELARYYDDIYQRTVATPARTEPEQSKQQETSSMFNNIIKNVTYVDNKAIDEMNKTELFNTLVKLEAQKKELQSLETASKAVEAQVKEIDKALTVVAKQLDSLK